MIGKCDKDGVKKTQRRAILSICLGGGFWVLPVPSKMLYVDNLLVLITNGMFFAQIEAGPGWRSGGRKEYKQVGDL